jgi:hypothetical protein
MQLKPQARNLARSTVDDAHRFTIRLQRAGGAPREFSGVYISSELYEGRRRWTIYKNPEQPEDLATLDAVDVDLNSSVGIQASAYWIERGRAERVDVVVQFLPRAAATPKARGRRTA